jgi:hypothetical protein
LPQFFFDASIPFLDGGLPDLPDAAFLPFPDAALPGFDATVPSFDAGIPPLAFDAALGMFNCGGAQCDGTSQYCQMGGTPQCVSLPTNCGSSPSCACLQQATGAPNCTGDNGGLTLPQLPQQSQQPPQLPQPPQPPQTQPPQPPQTQLPQQPQLPQLPQQPDQQPPQ